MSISGLGGFSPIQPSNSNLSPGQAGGITYATVGSALNDFEQRLGVSALTGQDLINYAVGAVKALELVAPGEKTALDGLISKLQSTTNLSPPELQNVFTNFFSSSAAKVLQAEIVDSSGDGPINGFASTLQTIFSNLTDPSQPNKSPAPTLTLQDARGACAIALSILNSVSSGNPPTLPGNATTNDSLIFIVLQGLPTSTLITSDQGFQTFGNLMNWLSKQNDPNDLQTSFFEFLVNGYPQGYLTGLLNSQGIAPGNSTSDKPLTNDQLSSILGCTQGLGQFIENLGKASKESSTSLQNLSNSLSYINSQLTDKDATSNEMTSNFVAGIITVATLSPPPSTYQLQALEDIVRMTSFLSAAVNNSPTGQIPTQDQNMLNSFKSNIDSDLKTLGISATEFDNDFSSSDFSSSIINDLYSLANEINSSLSTSSRWMSTI